MIELPSCSPSFAPTGHAALYPRPRSWLGTAPKHADGNDEIAETATCLGATRGLLVDQRLASGAASLCNISLWAVPLHTMRQPPIDELAIERRVCFLPSRFEVPPGTSQISCAAVELAESGVEQMVVT